MPLVAAAVCPHPPLLVPELAAGAAAELDGLRTACAAAIEALLAPVPDELLVVGAGPATAWRVPGQAGTLEPYGLPRVVPWPGEEPDRADLPLSLTIGAWLLHGVETRVEGLTVAADATIGECLALGHETSTRSRRTGLLVMGDGSACRGEKAPGYADPRAEGYDAEVARAFAEADVDALAALDPAVSRSLIVAGRAPWQVLAGATGHGWRGKLHYAEAPYGVAYFVASWEPRLGESR